MARLRHAGAAVFCALALTGCLGSTPPEKPPVAKIQIEGQKNLNPTASGKSTPVVVKLFALRREAKFRKSDFFGLYDNAEKTLGSDMVSSEEVTVRPKESVSRTWVLDPGTNYLGALAAFRNIDQSQWSVVKQIKRNKKSMLYKIRVGNKKVELTEQ